jgi:shikimate 5-dehydrogenase
MYIYTCVYVYIHIYMCICIYTYICIYTHIGEKVDLFINATPASIYPLNLAPNFLEALESCTIAFDHEMPGMYLAEYCSTHNIYLIEGLKMYYPQMYKQWALFLEGIVAEEEIPKLIAQANT